MEQQCLRELLAAGVLSAVDVSVDYLGGTEAGAYTRPLFSST